MNAKISIDNWLQTHRTQLVTAGAALLLVLPLGAQAGGVVTTCTEAALRAALAGGGTVTFACDGTVILGNTITNATNTVLDGTGHQVTISGGGYVRVFYVAASLTLIHLTISNGRTSDGTNGMQYAAGGPGQPGGGIYNADTLTMLDCIVAANRTGNGGNGSSTFPTSGGPGGHGGGIYNASTGTLTLSNCIVSGNSTGYGGTSSTIDHDMPAPVGGAGGNGAGICNAGGTLCLINSTVSGNNTGTGADNPLKGPGAVGGAGGGVWSGGNLTANGCTFSGNSTGVGGRGGNLAFGGNGGDGGLGGAICATGYAALTNCTLAGNFTGPGGAGGYGGSGWGGNGGSGGSGLGIYSQTNLDVVSCTIAANAGGSGGAGGQGCIGCQAGLTGSGGVFEYWNGGTARLLNTIVALNTGYSPDAYGDFLSLGHNLIGATNGSFGFPGVGDRVGSSASPLNPKIGPLANNGGPTLTMALLPGSPAIDAADSAAAPPTDQRGVPRPVGPAADIGAFEYGSVMPTVAVSRSGATSLNILASGNASQPCRLLSSMDLLSWVPIATNQIGSNGTILFNVNCAPGGACRFYRLVMP